jgi:hypothetical protein
MINNNNKIILLKELDKNNIISTLIEKGSDLIPTKHSKFNLGNENISWNKLFINEITNSNSIKIISNSENNNSKLILASNGTSLDALNIQVPYGGAYMKFGRELLIDADINSDSKLINFNASRQINLNVNKCGININNNNIKINSTSITIGDNINSEMIINGKLIVNGVNLIDDQKKRGTQYSIYVGQYEQFYKISEALLYIKDFREKNIDLNKKHFNIYILNDIIEEDILINIKNISISGYNKIKPIIKKSIKIFINESDDNVDSKIKIEYLEFESPKDNILPIIYLKGILSELFLNNISSNNGLLIESKQCKLIIKDSYFYCLNNLPIINILEILEIIFENNFIKSNGLPSDTPILVIKEENGLIRITNNKFYGVIDINSSKCIIKDNIFYLNKIIQESNPLWKMVNNYIFIDDELLTFF